MWSGYLKVLARYQNFAEIFSGNHRAFLLGAYTMPHVLTFNRGAPGVLLQQGVSETRPWG